MIIDHFIFGLPSFLWASVPVPLTGAWPTDINRWLCFLSPCPEQASQY